MGKERIGYENNRYRKENLLFILGLGALALVRPIMKMTGIMDLIGQAFGKDSDDGSHLFGLAHARSIQKNGLSHCHSCFAGLSYALFAIIISGIASPLIDGTLQGPLTNPLAMISVFAINAVWGLIVGVIANVLRRKG